MTLYSNRSLCVAAIVAALMLFFGCTKVDDNIGTDIIPSGQQMSVKFATLDDGINSYITYSDSIATGALDYAYFGQISETGFGTTKATALLQFAPSNRTDTVAYDNRISVPDSLWIICSSMSVQAGDTLTEQTFDVYRIKKMLHQDTAYYNSIDYASYIESSPMFTFTYGGNTHGSSAYDTLRLKVSDAAQAAAFMKELWELEDKYYDDDTLFLQKFNGLCITPSGTSRKDAAIYGMNLTWDSTYGPYNYLVFFGHDYISGSDPSIAEDDILRLYQITDNTTYSKQAAATAISHDYSTTSFASSVKVDVQSDEDLGTPVGVTYVQGILGVTTTIEFDDTFIARLKQLAADKTIFINQALLQVALQDPTYENFDLAPSRLGSYLKYSTVKAIADYNYYYEANYDSYTSNYGGYLNRSHGWYTMDVAVYLQRLLQGDQTARRITLGMPAYNYFDAAQVALLGTGSTTPVKISVTYTVKGK